MSTHEQPNIVSGGLSTVADLGRDDTWLQEWLAEDPTRLGLGPLRNADNEPAQDDNGNPAFLAADDERYFSVDVQLDELDAEHGFQVLDNWARNRVRHPGETYVAVLVTETTSDRYRTTLETLSEHLPLVVVELQVWRGETEAIVVPQVTLASQDLGFDPSAAVPRPAAKVETPVDSAVAAATDADDAVARADNDFPESVDNDDVPPAGADPETGVVDPWQLPPAEPEVAVSNGSGMLSSDMLNS
jgi:hypothetical protein